MFALILILLPFLLSTIGWALRHFEVLKIGGKSLGFSGIVSAFIGFLPYSALNFLKKFYRWKTSIAHLLLAVLSFSFGIIPLIYPDRLFLLTLVWGSFLWFLFMSYRNSSLGNCLSSLKIVRVKNKGIFALVSLSALLYLISIFSLFPRVLIFGETMVDITSHYVGLCFGFIISYFLFVGLRWTKK